MNCTPLIWLLVSGLGRGRKGEGYHGEDPVDPSVPDVVGDEPEYKRCNWDAECDHQRPDTHVSCSLFLGECLGDDCASNRCSGTDEECDYSSAHSHRSIAWAFGTAYIPYQTAGKRDEKQGPAAVGIGEGFPDERCYTQNGDL